MAFWIFFCMIDKKYGGGLSHRPAADIQLGMLGGIRKTCDDLLTIATEQMVRIVTRGIIAPLHCEKSKTIKDAGGD